MEYNSTIKKNRLPIYTTTEVKFTCSRLMKETASNVHIPSLWFHLYYGLGKTDQCLPEAEGAENVSFSVSDGFRVRKRLHPCWDSFAAKTVGEIWRETEMVYISIVMVVTWLIVYQNTQNWGLGSECFSFSRSHICFRDQEGNSLGRNISELNTGKYPPRDFAMHIPIKLLSPS